MHLCSSICLKQYMQQISFNHPIPYHTELLVMLHCSGHGGVSKVIVMSGSACSCTWPGATQVSNSFSTGRMQAGRYDHADLIQRCGRCHIGDFWRPAGFVGQYSCQLTAQHKVLQQLGLFILASSAATASLRRSLSEDGSTKQAMAGSTPHVVYGLTMYAVQAQ